MGVSSNLLGSVHAGFGEKKLKTLPSASQTFSY